MTTNLSLFQKAAANLSGRRVLVRFRKPAFSVGRGQAYKTENGAAVIDIAPDLTERDTLYVFLHEVSHIRDDFPDFAPADYWRAAPGSVVLNDGVQAALETMPREHEADDQARVWLGYSEKFYDRYQAPTTLERKLLALLEYPQQELIDRAQKTGHEAGLKLVSYLKTLGE
jgi:hypothetical protein